ncbi:MAG: LysR family transcriptional regulator [Mesosutterella sp.]|nr:LysR family transcriptional regulator [Mesosutterella sp.]
MKVLRNTDSWRALLEIGRQGSVGAAAGRLGFDTTALSRLIRQMEKELGFELLDRTRKPAVLSARARLLVPYAREFLRAGEQLLQAARSEGRSGAECSRRLRISIPTNAGRTVFYSFLMRFEDTHPGVRLEICADVGSRGLLEGRADIAFLGYMPEDPAIGTLPAAPSVTMLLASRGYVAGHGAPARIEELSGRTVLLRSSSNPSFSMRLEKGLRTYYLAPGQDCRQGDAVFCREALLAGRGIAVDVALGMVEEELSRGEVVPVLPGWHREPWRNCIAFRAADAADPLFGELSRLLRQVCDETETSLWQHWYRHFGIPLADVRLPAR